MKLFRRRAAAAQAGRVDRARAEAEAAAAEVDVSLQRAESARRHVVEPLRRAADNNQFAALIRATLINGNGGT